MGMKCIAARDHRGEVVAGMSPALADKPVVEIQIADHDAIGKRRQLGARRLTAAYDRGRHITRGDASGHAAGDLPGFAAIAAHRAGQGIDEKPLCLVDHLRREIFIREGSGVGREILRRPVQGNSFPMISVLSHCLARSERLAQKGAESKGRSSRTSFTRSRFQIVSISFRARSCPKTGFSSSSHFFSISPVVIGF